MFKKSRGHRAAKTPPAVKQDATPAFTGETAATMTLDIPMSAGHKIRVPELNTPTDFQIVVPEHVREYVDAYCDRFSCNVAAYSALSATERKPLPFTSRFRKAKGVICDAANNE